MDTFKRIYLILMNYDYPQSPPTRKRNGTLGALPQTPHTFWHCPKKYAKRSRN